MKKKKRKNKEYLPPGKGILPERKTNILDIVEDIPNNAETKELLDFIDGFIIELRKAVKSDIPAIQKVINQIKTHPRIIEALIEKYQSVPKENYKNRKILIQIIGELRLESAVPFLTKISKSQLPEAKPANYLNKRNQEEIIQIKAIQSIAYLRKEPLDQYLLEIMQDHESEAIKIAAIDAYMWNHDDSKESAKLLYTTLPQNYHRYIDRKRFGSMMDKTAFNKHIKELMDGGRK